MKRILFFAILILLNWNSFAQDPTERELWLLTAKITNNSTFRRDTVKSFMAGDKLWKEEKHSSGRSASSGTVTVVIENQADDPLNDFWFDSGAGDPKPMIVTGSGSSSHSSSYIETIDGKLIAGDKENGEVSGKASPGATVMFNYSNDSKFVEVIIGIKGVSNPKRQTFRDGEWIDYDGSYDYNITCSGGGEAPSANCKITKTGKGYQASWKMNENKQRSTVDGMEYTTSDATLEVTIAPYKEPDKPELTLYGCSELGTDEQSDVMASGKPEGGKFRFWVEPENLLNVQPDGESSANLTGASPGKGTLYVEYTSPEGKTNTTSQPASCVKIENYNNGQEIPQIALFDVDGKKLSGVLKIPVSAQPSNVEELVDFVSTDQSVLSVVGLSEAVELTGTREGKTTFQAKTNCGNTTGPAVNVEIVNCDDETIATLERMMKAAKEGQKDAYQAIERIVGTKEFEEMDSKIAESTGNLAVKTGGLIVGTLAGGTTAGAGVETAAGIYGKASNVMDIMKGGDALSQVSNISQLIVELGGKAMQQAIAGSIETLQAANEFGQDLGKMIGANRELQSAVKEAEHWNNIIIDLVNRQKLCRRGSQAPQGTQEPKTDPGKNPTPTPTEPTSQTQTPPAKEPATSEETQPTEPSTTDQPSDEGTEISPPPPTSEPRQVGLPFGPAECGCDHANTLDVSQKGFSSLQTGMENLEKCVDTFSKGPLTNYIQTLQDWQTVLNSLLEATKAKPAEFQQVSEKSIPKMESLLEQTKTFDTVGKTFVDEFGACPKSMESGVGLMQSAQNVPEISATTN